ncbi:MAG: right-handed parallel beta-helix repeat-containing protein [Phycisphaerae bacterium]|nr:right-handed parallel beta-helix repeat-containing protein [Phycisphaerae bacterium]
MTAESLDRRFLLGAMGGAAGVAALAQITRAGPLNPPPGPITPTQRPLGEIEPRTVLSPATTPGDATAVYVISQPGSYFLAGPVVGVAGRSGIKITASEVRLDLRGFSVVGVTGAQDGIVIAPPTGSTMRNVAIHDGGVAGWPGSGLAPIINADASGLRLERVTFSGNGADGARVPSTSIITDCHAIGNGGTGFATAEGSVMTRCSAVQNGSAGISAEINSRLDACYASGNGNVGFGLGPNCIVRNCQSSSGLHGFSASFSAGVVLESCVAAGCSANGFDLNLLCELRGCIAYSCDGTGFRINRRSRLIDCISFNNGAGGIQVIDGNHITGCICTSNGASSAANGPGILLTGTDNRVEACCLEGNGTGMAASAAGNFIARNTASGNVVVNWNIAANNKCLVVAGVNAPAINGSSGGVSPGSTDPNANYSF